MRRRDRFANAVWFLGWGPRDHLKRVTGQPGVLLTVGEAILTLVREHGMYVECSLDVDRYAVRLYPHRRTAGDRPTLLSFLYSGASLASILSVAVEELQELATCSDHPAVSTREVDRWVP